MYGEGMTVTSAMKGLKPTTVTMLGKIVAGEFEGGFVETLGLVSENPEDNYVQIPYESTQFDDNFTVEDYEALVAAMFNGEVVVNSDVSGAAADYVTVVDLKDLGNIK